MKSIILLVLVVSVSAQSDTPCWDEVDYLQSTGQADRPGAPSYDCDSNGKYEPVQCTGSKCHCVEPDGTRASGYRQFGIHLSGQYKCECARRLFEILQSGRVGELVNCDSFGNYAGIIDTPPVPDNRDTPCWDAGTSNVPGAFNPSCDSSGKYEPVQCKGAKCYCVTPDGARQSGFRQFGIHLSDQYKCDCARRLYEVNQSGRVGELVICDDFGNY